MSRILHASLRGFALSRVLSSISLQLTNVFLALLMLNRGLAVWQVTAFYAVYSCVGLAINHPCGAIIKRHGARHGFLLGYMARAIQSLVLTAYIAGAPNWTLGLLATSFAVASSFLLSAQHYHVSRVMSSTSKGRDVSGIEIMAQMVGCIAPLFGGLLAAARGQLWLGAIAAGLALAAIIPMWHSDRLANGQPCVPATKSLRRAPWPDLIASFAWTWQSGVGFWGWSIYLAVLVPNFQAIGAIASISALVTFVVMALAGRSIDRDRRGVRRAFLVATMLASAVHLARVVLAAFETGHPTPVLVTALVLTLSNAVYGVVGSMLEVTWRTHLYEQAAVGGIAYVTSLRIADGLSGISVWGCLTAIGYFWGASGSIFLVAFASSGLMVWGCLLLGRRPVQA